MASAIVRRNLDFEANRTLASLPEASAPTCTHRRDGRARRAAAATGVRARAWWILTALRVLES